MSQEEVDAANRLIIDLISKYRVIIAGCRDFAAYELLKERCDTISKIRSWKTLLS